MAELTGWLLDVYAPELNPAASEPGQATLWLLGDDGERRRLQQNFPVQFFAAGPPERLRALWRWLRAQALPLELARQERRDLFLPEPVTVLAVQTPDPQSQPGLFRQVAGLFPDLSYYDADIDLPLRYTARCGLFPLGRCRFEVDGDRVLAAAPLETPWELDPPAPPLRILHLEPDCDPAHAAPRQLVLRCERFSYRLDLAPARPLLVNLAAILRRHDPDLLLTAWGDTWLLPLLLELSERHALPLPLNRDPRLPPAHHPEISYFSYGQVVHRGRQVHLFGRQHIDRRNAMLWGDYELEGALESARVTGLPLQTAARVSPGSGISAMQMVTALRNGILVPWRKQQAEEPKSALELLGSDQGGMVYQPVIGLHRDVAAIDFVSMYPGIMVHFNISPETVRPPGGARPAPLDLAALEHPLGNGQPGLIPLTLAPLLEKRVELKMRLGRLPRGDARRSLYKARASAHKWLLVTCFGYLGYKNARFGRIEAHEAVTAYGREALLRAKETAEDLGFEVLHMYVDGLWVRKPGARQPDDFQALLEQVVANTHLPIALDGVYRWVAFLPSRVDARVPVANRYFGVFQDGSLKLRGIEARRRDSPAFITAAQQAIIELLAGGDPADLRACLPEAVELLRRRLAELRRGRVALPDLLVGQRLSRELGDYRTPSPSARAAAQLAAIGKPLRPGQRVRFIYTLGEPGVWAWDLPQPPDRRSVDLGRYTTLLLRAASAVLTPLGAGEGDLHNWLSGRCAVGERVAAWWGVRQASAR